MTHDSDVLIGVSKMTDKPKFPPLPFEVFVPASMVGAWMKICEQNRALCKWSPPCTKCGGSPCTVFGRGIQIYCNDCGHYTEEVDTEDVARKNWETGIVFPREGES